MIYTNIGTLKKEETKTVHFVDMSLFLSQLIDISLNI